MAPARKHSGEQTYMLAIGPLKVLLYSINGRVSHGVPVIAEVHKADTDSYLSMLKDQGVKICAYR